MNRLLSCLLALSVWLLISDVPSARAADPTGNDLSTIIAAIPRSFPPQYSIDEAGLPTGFAIEVMDAVADIADIKVTYVIKDTWRETQDALINGEAHIIPNLGISDNREKFATFTMPLEFFDISVFVKNETSKFNQLDNISGQIIGAVDANAGARVLLNRDDLKTKIFPVFQDALIALLSGRVDGVVYPDTSTWKIARELKLENQIRKLEPPLLTIKRAIAVRKDLPDLLVRLQTATYEFTQSAAYDKIYDRWHGEGEPFWTTNRLLFGAVAIIIISFAGLTGWRFYNMKRVRKIAGVTEGQEQTDEENTSFRTLTSKLLAIYVPLVAIAAIVLFLILEVMFYQKERDQLISSLKNVVTIQSAAFQSAVWEYDIDQIRRLLGDFLLLSHIQGAAVYDSSDIIMGQVGDIKTAPEMPDFKIDRALLSPSDGTTDLIGRLVVTVHSKQIWQLVIEHLKVNTIILLVLLASLITSTLFAVNRVISRPLLHLRQAIERTKTENIRTPVLWESGDELGQVVRAYNEMQEKEEAAKNEVKQYQENLENLVEERTQELEHKSTLLEAVLGSINQGLVAYDKELMLIISNKRFQEIRDVPDELSKPGASFVDWIEFDVERGEFKSGDPEEIIHDQILRAKQFVAHSFERTRPNGTIIEIQGGPLPGGGFVSTFTDITERKNQENALRRSEEQFRRILEDSPIAVSISLDDRSADDGQVQFGNPQFLDMLGISESDIGTFRTDSFVMKSESRDKHQVALNEGKSLRNTEQIIHSQDGRELWTLMSISPIEYQKKKAALVWLYDITERKLAENKLSDAYNVISSSIDYAARIQRSVLPDGVLFSSLLSDHFILWEPRDVVGGDIYWSRMWGDGFLIILGDCTGHGVPGAFMTLIATGALDNALSAVSSGEVAELMQHIHQLVQVTLGQHGDKGESDDGMELGICFLNSKMDKIIFVGARFELYLIENGGISVIKGAKSGIGYHGIPHDQVFEEHEIVNLACKSFYMTSDGLVDQIGGERNRMFGKNRFRKLLLDIQDKDMQNQRQCIREALINYQAAHRRRDDVAVIGFKIE